jgi:hypothetical protein
MEMSIVYHCRAVADDGAVVVSDGGRQFGDRLSLRAEMTFDVACGCVTGADRRPESPIDLEEHRSATRQLLRHNSIQECLLSSSEFPGALSLVRV